MKYLTIILVLLLFISYPPPVSAESWDDYANLDRAWDGQKSITNKEFEEAMDTLQAKQKKREAKQKKRKAKKISGGGTSLHSELNPEKDIREIRDITSGSEDILINVPVNLIADGKMLDKGYYQLKGERDKNGKIYISFYQAHFLKGKIDAVETEDDYNEDEVDFAKLIPGPEGFVKLIYGSVKFNAYAIIPYFEAE